MMPLVRKRPWNGVASSEGPYCADVRSGWRKGIRREWLLNFHVRLNLFIVIVGTGQMALACTQVNGTRQATSHPWLALSPRNELLVRYFLGYQNNSIGVRQYQIKKPQTV